MVEIINIICKWRHFAGIMIFITAVAYPQNQSQGKELLIGLNYGSGTSENTPFNAGSYDYDSDFFKVQLNYPLTNGTKWILALNVEPTYYRVDYYSNEYIATFASSQRVTIEDKLELNEFSLNLGLQLKYQLPINFTLYILGSIGPTITDKPTERLHEGFAFSDILAFGLNYRLPNFVIDFRASIRHVSNAGLYYPNKGYNSSGLEIGLSIPISKKSH